MSVFRHAAESLRETAMRLVQTDDGRVRVEDFLNVVASATGEAAIVASGVFDIEHNEMMPGQPVFGDAINMVLTGDVTSVSQCAPTSAIGALRDSLDERLQPLVMQLDLEAAYKWTAEHVGTGEWGGVVLDISDDNRPGMLPLQAAFELRPYVVAQEEQHHLETGDRGRLCAVTLGLSLNMVQDAIDPAVALTLSIQTLFGMAKMVPMSAKAMREA
jgi:hypothetical protein